MLFWLRFKKQIGLSTDIFLEKEGIHISSWKTFPVLLYCPDSIRGEKNERKCLQKVLYETTILSTIIHKSKKVEKKKN